ncbi:hypothetical protein ACLB2K_047364 [Fragaria x ananassa]
MLAKISWRMFDNDKGLWASMFSEKYLKNCNIFEDQYMPSFDCSSTWRAIIHGAELIRNNLKWRVGDATSIRSCEGEKSFGDSFGPREGQYAETISPTFKPANCIVQMPSIRSRQNSNSPYLGRKDKIMSTVDSSCTRCSGKSNHQSAEHVCWLIGAAVLGVPVKATIKEANNESFVVRTLDRRTLWEMQTP